MHLDKSKNGEAFSLFRNAYINCALWTEEWELCHIGEQLDEMRADAWRFFTKNFALMKDLCFEQCGHDFWLTRNGHGSGFWDRGYEQSLADKLTAAAKEFGEYFLNIGVE